MPTIRITNSEFARGTSVQRLHLFQGSVDAEFVSSEIIDGSHYEASRRIRGVVSEPCRKERNEWVRAAGVTMWHLP